jgi:type IV secretory pathway ATPase VirB11/archaellum biosynthesis ATPase
MLHQLHTYADLRKQIHHDLRIQHPEWVQPNGQSPMCDSYETRLRETLDVLVRQRPEHLLRL